MRLSDDDEAVNILKWIATDACNDDIQKGIEVVENRMTSTPTLAVGSSSAGGRCSAMSRRCRSS